MRLVLAFALLVSAVLSATPSQDRRCGTSAQAAEQNKLDLLMNRTIDMQCRRSTLACKSYNFQEFYGLGHWDPEFPGTFKQQWQLVAQQGFQQLEETKLDPYDYAAANEFFNRDAPWTRPGLDQECVDVMEDYAILSPNGAGFAFFYLPYFYQFDPAYGEAWQQVNTVPVYDAYSYQGLVLELQAVCPFVQARIQGDWWAVARQYVTSRGGFIPSWPVQIQFPRMLDMINVQYNSALGLSNPVIAAIKARGYPISPAELSATFAAMDQAKACVQQYYNYTVASAVPYTTSTTSNEDWYQKRAPAKCSRQYGVYFQSVTPERAQYQFDLWKATMETLIPQISAEMLALVPDYLGYNKTYIHATESLAASLNVTFIGWPNVQMCTTPNVYSNGTGYLSVVQATVQKVLENQHTMRTVGSPARFQLAKTLHTCNGFAGNAFNIISVNQHSKHVPSAVNTVGFWPTYFRNQTTTTANHEITHHNQFTYAAYSACETCYFRRFASTLANLGLIVSWSLGYGSYNLIADSHPQVWEGHATYSGHQFSYEYAKFYTPEEELNDKFFLTQSRYLVGVTNIGYYAPNGWTSDDECATWRQTHSWNPQSTYAAAKASCAAARIAPISGRSTIWYVSGMQFTMDYSNLAKQRCGSAFDPQYFMSLHYAHGLNSLEVTRMIYEDYINSGCQKTVTERGDCWKTVQPNTLPF